MQNEIRLIDANALISAIEKGEGISWERYGDNEVCVRKKYIDNAPTVEAFTEEDIKQTIKENFDIGYEMAKNKYETPKGEWIVTSEDNNGVHRICCPFCSYEKGSNNTDTIIVTFTDFPNFCEKCGAKMKGGAE